MDVLPNVIEVLSVTGKQCNPRRSLHRVNRLDWDESAWDKVILENVDALADCLREAGVIAEDSALRGLGDQIENIDVVMAEVDRQTRTEVRRLVLIEDKLVRNSEAKREVLAQILEYAHRVQHEWASRQIASKLGRDATTRAWVSEHLQEFQHIARQGDFLLVVMGDGIDERMERLARRFAAHDDPLSLSELALVSMPMYALDAEHYVFIPHVVSSVRQSHRGWSIRVVVQNRDGDMVDADVSLVQEEPGRSARLPVREEVRTFLRGVRDSVGPLLPGVKEPASPRKSLDYWETAADGTTVDYRVHFGGYSRDVWTPIVVGVQLVTRDAASRDAWMNRFKAVEGLLPPGTVTAPSGDRTLDVTSSVAWSSPSDLNEVRKKEVVDRFGRVVTVTRKLMAEVTTVVRT